MSTEQLFSAFPPVSFETWKAKVASELGGKPFEALFREPEPGLLVSPYIHPDVLQKDIPGPLNLGRSDNNWAVTVGIHSAHPDEAHILAMEALEGGADALRINIPTRWEVEDFGIFLKDIHLNMIALQVHCTGDLEAQLHTYTSLDTWLAANWAPTRVQLQLGIHGQEWLKAGHTAALAAVYRSFGRFSKAGVVALHRNKQGQALTQQLATLLLQAEEIVCALETLGISPDQTLMGMSMDWPLGHDFFLELSSIRAWHLLWANYLKARSLQTQPACITAFQDMESMAAESNSNMIAASTQSMSAVMGGVQQLLVLPPDTRENPNGTEFTRRIARNLQHILRYEAFLDKVVDPAAGSRFIEQLTLQIAQSAWQQFQDLADR
jgi:methylmalonyl-CoA mutase